MIAGDRLHNLPAHLPSLIGREDAVVGVRDALLHNRTGLLTLTGVGGSGKTRLALAVAQAVLDAAEFEAGVWLADLASISDPQLVAAVVASSVGVREQPGRPLRDTLL